MQISKTTIAKTADTLRSWALNESLKAEVMNDPAMLQIASKIARRYVAGHTMRDALLLLEDNILRNHLSSIEFVGESVRKPAIAVEVTNEILRLIKGIPAHATDTTISLDLSHIGLLVSPELALNHGLKIAQAARNAGSYMMVSAEGSNRTDSVLDTWERLSDAFPETGITLQARLYRTPNDLQRVLGRPGPVRIVKGAFLETDKIAASRELTVLGNTYRQSVSALVHAGHRVNIATHDPQLLEQLKADLGVALYQDHVEFEMLQGLGTELLDQLRADGFKTREYIVYGPDWWLYVLNRIAERPEQRVFTAISDLEAQGGLG
ncbi:proline dehydrogenase family protein [Glutamicibacter endophyticus]|uniref:proline dehydrogenase family protein n=1 Tax=Glutamicibacter endophyticus TaxID=1522174 RepID=UPI003AF0D695